MLVTGTPALPISISERRYEAELAPSSEPPPGHPEDSERVQGDQLVRAAPTPVDDLGLPGAGRRAPPASPRLPAAVRPPAAEQVGESVVHALAFRSQFQPPSGHCHSTSERARSSTRGSSARPSRQQTASALPSCDAQGRASPPITLTPFLCLSPVSQASTVATAASAGG